MQAPIRLSGKLNGVMSLTVTEISSQSDFIAWDQFVAKHPQGSFAQLSGWANLKQQFEWQPHILVIKNKDEIVAGALMMDRYSVFSKKISYVPYGPIVQNDFSQALPILLEALMQESSNSVVLRLEPHIRLQDGENEGWQEILTKYKFQASNRFLQPEETLIIDTNLSEDQLLANMRQTTRRYIRQAERAGVTVAIDQTGQRLPEFYQILQQVNQRKQFGVHTLEYYQAAWDCLSGSSQQLSNPTTQRPTSQPYLIFAQKNQQVVGAYFIARVGNKSWELYGGVNQEGMKMKASYILKWQSIVAMKQAGVTQYDQWGVAPTVNQQEGFNKNHPLSGVTYFKTGFGGTRVAYIGSYDKVNQPLIYNIARKLKKL